MTSLVGLNNTKLNELNGGSAGNPLWGTNNTTVSAKGEGGLKIILKPKVTQT
jgi:hypothetical protein